MEHTCSIVVGDWSKDGHNQSDKFIFKTTHDKNTIVKAYLEAVDKSKVSLHHINDENVMEILSEYEEGSIPTEALERLESIGCKFEWRYDDFWEKNGKRVLGCSPECVANLYLEMAGTQLSDFKYEIVTGDYPEIRGIGYGVYN